MDVRQRDYYKVDRSVTLNQLVVHYKMADVLRQLGITVIKADPTEQNRRLFGAAFDAPEDGASAPPSASSSTASTGARAPAATGAASKVRRIDLD